MMRQGYNNDAVCQLIEHVCWSSSERTKWVAMNIYQRFIARVGNLRDHIANAKFGIVRFLSIKDELRSERAKMLLQVIPGTRASALQSYTLMHLRSKL